MELARRAINLGKDDPDTLCWSSIALAVIGREYAVAEVAANRALALNPSAATGRETKGWIACYQDQNDAAIAPFKRALQLSPLIPSGVFLNQGSHCEPPSR